MIHNDVGVGDPHCHGHTEEDRSGTRKSPSQWKVSDLDIILSEPIETWDAHSALLEGDSKDSEFLNSVREANSQLAALVIDSLPYSAPHISSVFISMTYLNLCTTISALVSNPGEQMVWET